MSTTSIQPAPSTGTVAREQLRAVGLSVRKELILAALAMTAVTAIMVASYVQSTAREREYTNVDFMPEVFFPLFFLGLAAPLAIWWGEEPARRGYLWSLPMDRGRLHLTKAGAGWAWMIGFALLYGLWMLALHAGFGGRFGEYELLRIQGTEELLARARAERIPFRPGPEHMYRATLAVPLWQWIAPFAAATVSYLYVTALTLRSNHPIRWLIGIWLGLLAMPFLANEFQSAPLARAMEAIEDSLYTLAAGTTEMQTTLTNGLGASTEMLLHRPSLSAWLTALAVWGIPAVLLAWLSATRHREG